MDIMDDDKKNDERLCASCDRCRARKTKCDGKRPCGNCAAKYMKKHKVTSVDDIDPSEFECIYSPAKRRGPVPGRSSQVRKLGDMQSQGSAASVDANVGISNGSNSWSGPTGAMMQQQSSIITSASLMNSGVPTGNNAMDGAAANNMQQQITLLQRLQQQQQHQYAASDNSNNSTDERAARRLKLDESQQQSQGCVPRTVTDHTHLLDRSDPDGARLFSYYKLSIDELFRLPPTPTDEEYCLRLNIPGVTPRLIPGAHLAALSAARFAEIALGAMVHNETNLAMELCNAVVHCLRESVKEPVQTPILFEVAKAYFLLGTFRACRGDMARYFKYRRVCMTYLGKLESDGSTATLVAAISYLDAWAYMIYNGNEKLVPDVDATIPFPMGCGSGAPDPTNPTEMKYNCKTDVPGLVSDPKNKCWIQGAPGVYLNNEAPLHARSLDALSCAVRSCCDQANTRFAQMLKSDGQNNDGNGEDSVARCAIMTPTTTAILAHEDELCSRNMVLSAYTLLQQQESSTKGRHRSEGQQMVISAMDAFLENSEDEGTSGFTDSQIQSLLSVCNTAVENPFLLHHAGPTYHMVTNAAVLLCHLLNGMYAVKQSGQFGAMEAAMFEEVLDTFIAIRKLLTIHRRKLPVKLRCHGVPRPSIISGDSTHASGGVQTFIDLGETMLCACRGCQGFVLMACSPCVAAERARSASKRVEMELAQESQAIELGEVDQELEGLGAEFDVDDDALLGMISSLISS